MADMGLAAPPWRQSRARTILEDFDSYYVSALPKFLARVVVDTTDRTIEAKLIRAHRRGLMLFDRIWDNYPVDWEARSAWILKADRMQCALCGIEAWSKPALILQVHHIIHKSRGGTHDRRNLVTLCFECHQKQHDHQLTLDVSGIDLSGPSLEVGGLHRQTVTCLGRTTDTLLSRVVPSDWEAAAREWLSEHPERRLLAREIDAQVPRVQQHPAMTIGELYDAAFALAVQARSFQVTTPLPSKSLVLIDGDSAISDASTPDSAANTQSSSGGWVIYFIAIGMLALTAYLL
jgi:hypothetical protein